MSRRVERVGNQIRSIVAGAIQSRLSDPRIEPMTSITRVEVSADFSVARVYVSVMASESRQKLCLQALQSSAGRLRGIVAREVTLRQIPRLDFYLDGSLQRSFETVQAIDEAMAELGERPPWEMDEDSDSPEAADENEAGLPDRREDG